MIGYGDAPDGEQPEPGPAQDPQHELRARYLPFPGVINSPAPPSQQDRSTRRAAAGPTPPGGLTLDQWQAARADPKILGRFDRLRWGPGFRLKPTPIEASGPAGPSLVPGLSRSGPGFGFEPE